jgi:hypothetical protein
MLSLMKRYKYFSTREILLLTTKLLRLAAEKAQNDETKDGKGTGSDGYMRIFRRMQR